MGFPRRIQLALILGVALVTASTGSQASGGFVTYTVSTPANQMTDFSQTLTVPEFNSSLGTLESVTLSLSDHANLLGSLLNKSASARDFTISEDVNFSVALGGTSLLSNDLSAQKSYSQLARGATATFGAYSLTGTTGLVTVLSPTILNSLTGSSTASFNFATLTNQSIGGGGANANTSFHTTADATLTITYNYISNNVVSVPEPASLAMTGLGGLLVAAVGFFRNRTRASR